MPVTTIADLLTLLTRQPGRPRITWYSADGERVELSGAVLDNWVSKTVNLLVEEFDVGPGARVTLDLPGHWRAVVWALAVWRVGAGVVTPGADGDATDLVVTADPGSYRGVSQLVAVSLPMLSRRFPGDLPAGAVDAASAVMTYGDAITTAPPTDLGATALVTADRVEPHATLVAHAVERAAVESPARWLVAAEASAGGGVGAAEDALAALAGDGSVVLVDEPLRAALAADPLRLDRLRTTEQVTAERLG
ncbi:TIGR03089 family protein [Cellulomonas sp. URHB0016]